MPDERAEHAARRSAAPGVALEVDGVPRSAASDPATPLVLVLRDEFGIAAARSGCARGECDACTVWLDGEPVHSCRLELAEVAGRRVTTAAGLAAAHGGAHPFQRALLERRAGQCGYCLSGIVMAGAALLRELDGWDDARARAALDGHLCRCGAHGRILAALRDVAEDAPGGAA